MDFSLKKFDDLTLSELYEMLKLRNAIFIVEQNCPYQDIDGKDQEALHIIGKDKSILVACLRIIDGKIPAIGRVVVHQGYRGRGIAREIMQKAIDHIKNDQKRSQIKLQAQVYLKEFYMSMGFEPISQEYLEDNIPHVDMLLK